MHGARGHLPVHDHDVETSRGHRGVGLLQGAGALDRAAQNRQAAESVVVERPRRQQVALLVQGREVVQVGVLHRAGLVWIPHRRVLTQHQQGDDEGVELHAPRVRRADGLCAATG
ncbi:MAG: hypothetical protein R2717_06350 [Schumannella sp.]